MRSRREVRFRCPGSEMLENQGCLPLSPGKLRQREAASLSHPACPPGTHRLASPDSPSAPRFSTDPSQRLRRSHTPGPATPPARLSSQAAAARAGHGLMDQPAESFLRGKRRDGAGRGRGGGEGKGRQRTGRGGGTRPAGASYPPHRKPQGRRVPGPAPRLRITTIIIMRGMEFGLGASQCAKPCTIFFYLILFINPIIRCHYPHLSDI